MSATVARLLSLCAMVGFFLIAPGARAQGKAPQTARAQTKDADGDILSDPPSTSATTTNPAPTAPNRTSGALRDSRSSKGTTAVGNGDSLSTRDDASQIEKEEPEREPAGVDVSAPSPENVKPAPSESSSSSVSAPSAGIEISSQQTESSRQRSEIKEAAGAETPQTTEEPDTTVTEPEKEVSTPPATNNVPEAVDQGGGVIETQTEESSTVESTTQEAPAEQPADQAPAEETDEIHDPAGASAPATVVEQKRLLAKVRQALTEAVGANERNNVHAALLDGKIVLKGTVASETEKQQILENLKATVFEDQIIIRSNADEPLAEPNPQQK